MGTRQRRFQCANVEAALADARQSIQVSGLNVDIATSSTSVGGGSSDLNDITVLVEGGIVSRLSTGYLIGDIQRAVPGKDEGVPAGTPPVAASGEVPVVSLEPLVEQKSPAATKLRVLVNTVDCTLQPVPSDPRHLCLRFMNLSIFSWPPVLIPGPSSSPGLCGIWRKSVDISVEAISAAVSPSSGETGSIMTPILSPLELNASITRLSPDVPRSSRTRTEVEVRATPLVITAGGQEVRLLADVFKFSPPAAGSAPSAAPASAGPTNPVTETREFTGEQVALKVDEWVVLELDWHDVAGRCELASASASACVAGPCGAVLLQLLRGVRHHELEPWQAVKLPEEAYPCCAIKVDRPAAVSGVAMWAILFFSCLQV